VLGAAWAGDTTIINMKRKPSKRTRLEEKFLKDIGQEIRELIECRLDNSF
jgi:hypothetical protein